MASLLVEPTSENRFAVYCGAGVYVSHVSHQNKSRSVVSTGAICSAMAATRSVAIAALHTARRAGLSAWIVRHPEMAVAL